MPHTPHCSASHASRAVLLLLIGVVLLWPTPALAGTCSDAIPFTDVDACLDGMQYSVWRTTTATLWILPRLLLQATYYVGALRGLLVGTVFAGVYGALGDIVNEVLIGMVTLALLLWGVLQLALPLLQRPLLNLRHILTWGLLAPLLITSLGPAFGFLDGLRVSLGSAFFSTAFAEATVAFVGPAGSDLRPPTPLYPSTACGTLLARPTGLVAGTVLLDDLAAALLVADAQDIHCPEVNATLSPPRPPDLPRAFYDTPPAYTYADPATPARIDQVGDIDDALPRQEAVTRVQTGLNRVLMSIIPAGLALAEALVQLLLSLSLVIIWLSLPIVSLFIVFQQDEGPILVLIQRSAKLFQVTLVTSILLGIVTALLTAAANAGSAMAFTGMALVTSLLVVYLVFTAFAVLWESMLTVRESITVGTGTNPLAPIDLAAGAALMAGSAVVTGGVSLAGAAATGLTAARETGSSVTGLAAGLGTIRPLMRVGEVAAGMGWAGGSQDEVFTGLAAGDLARRRGIGAMQRDLRRSSGVGDQEEAGSGIGDRGSGIADPRGEHGQADAVVAPIPDRPVIPDTRQQEQVAATVSQNWERLREQVTLEPPAAPVTGPTAPLMLPDALREPVVLDAPSPAAVHPGDDVRDITERELREQTGAVSHGMQELTTALREGLRDLADAARDADGERSDSLAAEPPADAAHDLAWELEANSDRDTLRHELRQDAAYDQEPAPSVPAQVDTQQLTQRMQSLSGTLREQAAQAAVNAVAGRGGERAPAAPGGDGFVRDEPAAHPSTSSGSGGDGIAHTLDSQRPVAAAPGSGGGDQGSEPASAAAAPIRPQPASAAPAAPPPARDPTRDPVAPPASATEPAIRPQPTSGAPEPGAKQPASEATIRPQPASTEPAAPHPVADSTRDPAAPAGAAASEATIRPQPASTEPVHPAADPGRDPAAPAGAPKAPLRSPAPAAEAPAPERPAPAAEAPAPPPTEAPLRPPAPARPAPPPPPRTRPAPPRQAADDPPRDPPAEADPTRDPPTRTRTTRRPRSRTKETP